VRTRDYCTTPRHIVAMCLNVIRVSVESENFAHVQNYVQKASQVPDLNEPIVLGRHAGGFLF
jgi:COP9 signalosome complex subunit 1